MNSFTAFSVKPLRFATTCGIAFAFIGMLLVVYTVVHKLVNPNVAIGYSSLMSMLLFIGGMIMFMLGLIGEYIGRIYISLNNSPQFVIREIYGQTGEKREEQSYYRSGRFSAASRAESFPLIQRASCRAGDFQRVQALYHRFPSH